MRILVIKGQSQYGGTRLFADSAAAAFRRHGHDAQVLDLGHVADAGPAITQHTRAAEPFDLVFSINILGGFRDAAGRSLSQIYGAPHVLWCTDYVFGQVDRLRATPKTTALLLVDPSQVRAVRTLYGDDRFDHLGFLPHAAVGQPAPDDQGVAEFVERRPIQMLWAGGFQAPDPPWVNAEGPARAIFQDAFDLAMSLEWMPPNVALDQVLAARGADLSDPALIAARESAALIDTEVRRARRFAFLQGVAATGLPLHICGAGWEGRLDRFRNATFEGEVEMGRLTELMARSRLVLNTNGNFGEGSHERPFSASLAGAAVFSDFSPFYAAMFEPSKTIELFLWKDLDAGMAALTVLADDPERCWRLAQGAKAATLAGHTWDHRVGSIIAAAEAGRGGRG